MKTIPPADTLPSPRLSGGILFCAATHAELDTLAALHLAGETDGRNEPGGAILEEREPGRLWTSRAGTFAVTGVGIPHTLLRLPSWLAEWRPSLVVNTGIAGAYVGSGYDIGDVVLGTSEVFADLGMETPGGEGFEPLGVHGFADESLRAPLPLSAPEIRVDGLKRGRGATVNQCTGTEETGARRRRAFGVDFESMEGAAAALAARAAGIPFLEIRAISNFAARRDMRSENVARALHALTDFWARGGREVLRAAHPKDRI